MYRLTHTEDDLVPLSALQHWLFCQRQCALIHLERVWIENRYTAEGQILHRRAHDGKSRTRDGLRITKTLPLRSFELGVSGQADIIEWRPPADLSDRQADRTLAQVIDEQRPDGLAGWKLTPIEYKRGRPKTNDCDRVQLCAQAMCLEEMLGVSVGEGQLFYGEKRRRFDVTFDNRLRDATRRAARQLHEMIAAGTTPSAVFEKKCETCSLLSACLPQVTDQRNSARRFFEIQFSNAMKFE